MSDQRSEHGDWLGFRVVPAFVSVLSMKLAGRRLHLIYENLAFVIVGSIDQLTLVIDRDIAEWCPLQRRD